MEAEKTDFEREREERIAENKRKLAELGVLEAVAELQQTQAPKRPRQQRPKVVVPDEEKRRSSRPRAEVDYKETIKLEGRPREPVDYTERLQAIQLDQETAEKLRAELASREPGKQGGKRRGPVDSGKGVRVQGGRVYDSTHGVTCHWCRQKTLEDHVTCTNPGCGNGKRMPLSFCNKCLRNRHGEDGEAAAASGAWWCPCCRKSCGPGCVICCNCGPCRKKAGLEPTHQVVRLARDAGFGNVHDYLVHLVTGEDQDTIAARKSQHAWGAWITGDAPPPAAAAAAAGSGGEDAEEAGSGASEQTGRRGGGAEEVEEGQEVAGAAAAAAGGGRKGGRGKKAAQRDQDKPAAGKRGRKAAAGKQRRDQQQQEEEGADQDATDVLPAAGKKGAKKAAAAAAAPAPAAKAPAAAAEEVEEEDDLAAVLRQERDQDRAEEEAAAAAAGDAKLSRRQRMLQKLGLVCSQ